MEYEPFKSRLLGTDELATMSYRPLRELSAQERKDLIVPPSGRLPMESVRLPAAKANPTGIIWGQLEGMGTTWDDLENTKLVRVQQSSPVAASANATKRWWHGLSGVGKWLVGIVGTIIAGVAVLLIRTWLIGQGIVRP